jgi:hypothetical protein
MRYKPRRKVITDQDDDDPSVGFDRFRTGIGPGSITADLSRYYAISGISRSLSSSAVPVGQEVCGENRLLVDGKICIHGLSSRTTGGFTTCTASDRCLCTAMTLAKWTNLGTMPTRIVHYPKSVVQLPLIVTERDEQETILIGIIITDTHCIGPWLPSYKLRR